MKIVRRGFAYRYDMDTNPKYNNYEPRFITMLYAQDLQLLLFLQFGEIVYLFEKSLPVRPCAGCKANSTKGRVRQSRTRYYYTNASGCYVQKNLLSLISY